MALLGHILELWFFMIIQIMELWFFMIFWNYGTWIIMALLGHILDFHGFARTVLWGGIES